MDDKDGRKMELNCNKLVAEINWPEIWLKLIKHEIYRQGGERVRRWKDDLNNATTHKEIYSTITKWGPEAFEKFVRCLREIGRNDLANILKPDNSTDQVHINIIKDLIPEVNGNSTLEMNTEIVEEKTTDDFYTRLHKTDELLQIVLKKSKKFMEDPSGSPCYPMKSHLRGLVLIINNIKFPGEEVRLAAEHDETNLKDLFDQMGFVVETAGNLTCSEMLVRIGAFSEQPKLRLVDSMFVIIMSHGNEHVKDNGSQSAVYGVDGEFITDSHVWDYFSNEACQALVNKPKIFIFQTCRGERVQKVVMATNMNVGRDADDVNLFVPLAEPPVQTDKRTYSDILVVHSTLPGHKAHRDEHTGSWYIQMLCEVIMNHAHNEEFISMLQKTDRRLSQMQTKNNGCQTSSFTSFGFNKKCYLNPGYFGD